MIDLYKSNNQKIQIQIIYRIAILNLMTYLKQVKVNNV